MKLLSRAIQEVVMDRLNPANGAFQTSRVIVNPVWALKSLWGTYKRGSELLASPSPSFGDWIRFDLDETDAPATLPSLFSFRWAPKGVVEIEYSEYLEHEVVIPVLALGEHGEYIGTPRGRKQWAE